MIQIDVLQFLVGKEPNRTEVELARAIHGDAAYQQQVNQDIRMLIDRGEVERRGSAAPASASRVPPPNIASIERARCSPGGGPNDPYRYYLRRKG
jgi:hypothetical protein